MAKRWQDLSLRRRLMGACFLLTVLPVLLIGGFGWLLVTGIDLYGGTMQGDILRLWPRGAALSIQYAVYRLREEADHEKFNWHEVKEQCDLLEANGVQAWIEQDGEDFYRTSGAVPEQVKQAALQKMGDGRQALVWDDDGLGFVYVSSQRQAAIYAAGDIPYKALPFTSEQQMRRRAVKAILFLVFGGGILLSLLLGAYLARSLSRQVLGPLSTMRRSAAAIEQGNYDVPVASPVQEDEVGATCRSFDEMRKGLKAAREERERYERSRKELIAGISHDLATPLTAIQGYASGILEGVARTTEKRRHYLAQIVSAAKVMDHLVANLFLFSKLELGRVDFTFIPVRPAAYFDDFLAERGTLYEEQGMTLRFHHDDSAAKRVILIDPLEFQRVIENILGNSRKYGGAEPCVDITLRGEDAGVLVALADHGKGVPTEELPRLFESFYRADKARSHTEKGSGLGLAIAHRIIHGFGGRIWAEETMGGGLTVKIFLPWAKEEMGGACS